MVEKVDICKSYPENSFTTKLGEHISSSFSMSAISPFKSMENKHDAYWCKSCIKKFCESLREHAMDITNFKKKKLRC